MLLNGEQIKERVHIHPLHELVRGRGIVSNGLGRAGYDITLGGPLRLLRKPTLKERFIQWAAPSLARDKGLLIDPCNFNTDLLLELPDMTIPPHSSVLGVTEEYFEIPGDVVGLPCCKSTLARCFLHSPLAALEPGWKGWLTLELTNLTPWPIVLKKGMGIGQVHFFHVDECSLPLYNGKYNEQPDYPVSAL